MEVTPRPLARGPGPPCPEKAPGRAAERALQQPPFLAAHQGAKFTAAPERDWIIQLACSGFSKGLTPGKRGFFQLRGCFSPTKAVTDGVNSRLTRNGAEHRPSGSEI